MGQLLTTKLYIPSVRPELVPRPRLIDKINEGLLRKLTLLSAPAGFGKTTLLGEWIPKSPRCVTWLSLDQDDKDSTRFWTYFIYSLQGLRSDLGAAALAQLHSPQAPPITSILTTLINDIATFQDNFAIVLDDYHVIDAKPVDEALSYLLKNLPPQMHVVIASREDPNLPISRFRVQDQLNEFRSADIRFTPDEASRFLNQVMGLSLPVEEVNSLETRTEGWIAGLQLAALSMQGREDVHGFIKAFAGDNRYIVDYLVEEVLERQSESVRSFLLQTSILDRLSGPLCDAVRYGKTHASSGKIASIDPDGTKLLEALERGNLFVIPLDDKRRWFRYHQLFADVLRVNLMAEFPEEISTLHRRAGKWYEQNGFVLDAIHHALAAGDMEWAADLIELAWSEMDRSRQSARWLDWVKKIPDELVRARPVLSLGYAWALLDRGRLEAGEARLRDAERWLISRTGETVQHGPLSLKMVVADKDEFNFLPASIASARAYLALALGDVPGTLKYARRALSLLPKEEHLRRGTPAALLALASWTCGDLEAADQSLADAMSSFQQAGNILFAITGAFHLADIRATLGRLNQALVAYQQSLQLAEGHGKSVLWGTADLHTGMSELFREQNDLEAAAEHLLRSKELGEQAALPRWRFRWCLARARVQKSQGDLNGALALLDEAERHYVQGPVPDVRPIAALKTRVWIAQNKMSEALSWAREQGLSPNDDLSYGREFEHITLARVLIAQYTSEREDRYLEEARAFLERLLKAAEEGSRAGSVIEILVLQALVYDAQGNLTSALECLERALKLAEPEGYVRIFVDEGNPMAHLLSEASSRAIMPEYAGKLLSLFKGDKQKRFGKPSPPIAQATFELLSQRELEVLSLIALGLSNREISEQLYLALSTVKGHTRNIYGKLQVRRRTEAVVQARELGLI